MADRIGSPNFLALVTILTEGVSASKVVPFLDKKLDEMGFNTSSHGSESGDAETFLDCKSMEL